MREITRMEKDFLIEKGYLKVKSGRYPGLTITSKYGKGKRKKYYVLDSLAELAKLLYVKENEMVDVTK